jgi:hypothetical protein
MITDEMRDKFRATLEKLPYGYLEMNVFGTLRLNIHIICEGKKTADQWHMALNRFCSFVRTSEHVIYNKENRGTILCPTIRKGYLIGAWV